MVGRAARVTSALFVFGALAGCAQGATNVLYTPVTGIEVPAAAVTAGHGCGDGRDQVFAYGALVTQNPEGGTGDAGVVASNVFSCFADGVFSNLPASDSGSESFAVSVLAFSQCSFNGFMDGGLACPMGVTGNCPGEDAVLLESAIPFANWSTTCTATQVANVTVVAACQPLTPTDGGSACANVGSDASGD
jgi:hypothetical protein